ncbi:hypothetical protein L209DRAFT_806295 [Thermothelomyces heterothallicus CBS 203.75]
MATSGDRIFPLDNIAGASLYHGTPMIAIREIGETLSHEAHTIASFGFPIIAYCNLEMVLYLFRGDRHEKCFQSDLTDFTFRLLPNAQMSGFRDWISQCFIRLYACGFVRWHLSTISPMEQLNDILSNKRIDHETASERAKFNYIINFKFNLDSSGRLVGERAYIEFGTFRNGFWDSVGLGVKRFGFGHYRLPYIDSEGVITPEDPKLTLKDLGFIIGQPNLVGRFGPTNNWKPFCTTDCRTCSSLRMKEGLTEDFRYILPGMRTKDFYPPTPPLQTAETTQPKTSQTQSEATQPKTEPKTNQIQPEIQPKTAQSMTTQPKTSQIQPKPKTQPKTQRNTTSQTKLETTPPKTQPKTAQSMTTQPKPSHQPQPKHNTAKDN